MGIKGLKSYILNLKSGIRKIPLVKYHGKTIALDYTNFLYKFLLISDSPDYYLLEFINIIHKFSKYGINVIFIFDGKPIDEKQKTIEIRKNIRKIAKEKYEKLCKNNDDIVDDADENININNEENIKNKKINLSKLRKKSISIKLEHIENCKKLFDLMGIEWYHLKNTEADIIFKYLFDIGKIDACYSADMDILLYECPILLQDLDFINDEIYEYDYFEILKYLNLTSEQLLNASIASGTDYNYPLKYSKIDYNIELIKKYNTIENIINNLENINKDREYKIEIPIDFNYKFSIKNYKNIISDDLKLELNNQILFYTINKKDSNSISRVNISQKMEIIIKKIKSMCAPIKFIYKIQEFCNYKYGFKI